MHSLHQACQAAAAGAHVQPDAVWAEKDSQITKQRNSGAQVLPSMVCWAH